jgi:hypothetical protein
MGPSSVWSLALIGNASTLESRGEDLYPSRGVFDKETRRPGPKTPSSTEPMSIVKRHLLSSIQVDDLESATSLLCESGALTN